MSSLGYDSITCAHHFASINSREDFDVHRDEFLRGWPRADIIRDFVVFVWAIQRADVFFWYFDGGYLAGTALRWLEIPLLHLAGKKVVVFPYGGDIAVVGEIGIMEQALLEDYPDLIPVSEAKRRRIVHICTRADLVVRNYQYGFIPRADVLWPTMIAIDTDQWAPDSGADPELDGASGADGHSGEVVVVHAPNHRGIKGTQELIDTVEQLRADGLQIRLELMEGRSNEEVRAAIRRCDIVADQFIAGYALFAIEGLSAGKPVMSALGWMPGDVARSLAERSCPIVDTDVANLADILRALVTDPGRRARLGQAGRDFALRCHAYEPVARTWGLLIDHAWRGSPLPDDLRVTERSRSPRSG